MQVTIYIRKENEQVWAELGKAKSAWVNDMLSKLEQAKEKK